MVLTLTSRKQFVPYDGAGKPSRWQTDVVAEDIAAFLSARGIRCDVEPDDEGSLISWTARKMRLWIRVECVDTGARTFQLDIGAGKAFLFVFPRVFPDSVFANEPWLQALKKFVSDGGSDVAMKRPPERPNVMPSFAIPMGLHKALVFTAQVVGAVTLVALFFLASVKRIDTFRWYFTVLFFGSFLLGSFLLRLAFRNLIPAKCPQCGGRAVLNWWGRPMTYRCESCRRIYSNRVKEGISFGE